MIQQIINENPVQNCYSFEDHYSFAIKTLKYFSEAIVLFFPLTVFYYTYGSNSISL